MTAGIQSFQALSDLVDGRCYPMVLPEGADDTAPFIIYQIISSVPEDSFCGHIGHERARVQYDIYHQTYDACIALKDQVIWRLNEISQSEIVNTDQDFDYDARLFHCRLDCQLWQTLT